MELLYLMPGAGMPEDEIRRREKITNSLVRPGSRVTVKEVGKGPLSIESTIEEYMSIGPMLEWLHALRRDLIYDAIIIGCAGDPGLRAVRELMDIPVIGPAEASYLTACMIADRFSIISPLHAGVASDDAVVASIRELGLTSRLASVEFVDIPITEMWREESAAVVEQVSSSIEAAKKKGAGCAVLGCMSMAFRTVATDWEKIGLPIINPLKVAIKSAELFVDLGLHHSRITYPAADFEKLAGTVFKE